MISTKMSKEEAKEYSTGMVLSPGDAPAYSYGTMVCLDDELLEKLGYAAPPPVGTVLKLVALVTVTSTSVNQQQDGDAESRCELQITDMELTGASAKSDAEALYSD